MANKAQINPVEQKTMVQGQAKSLNYKPIMTNANFAQGLSELSNGLSNAIYEQNKRIEKLKFADNDEKLKITSAEMNLALSKAKDQDEFDAIKKEYTDRMKNESKARLGKMYDKWNNLEGSNFMSAMEVDIKEKQIGLNDKIAKETATSTIKDMAYQWGYAPTEEARRVQDDVFNDYLANSGFNVAEQEAYRRKYDHDKEHGYLTQEVVKNPAKVKKLLDDPKNYDNLTIEERESFKHNADTAEKALKESKEKGFDEAMSQKIASVKLNSVIQLEQMLGEINSAKVTRDGKTVYDEGQLNFQTVLSSWDYVTSLGNDPMKIDGKTVQNPNGKITYTLSKSEELEYKKKLLPAMIAAADMVSRNEQGAGNDSAFRYQLKMLSKAAKKSKNITPLEMADLMRSIWRENAVDDGVYGQGWAMKPLESFGTASMQDEYRLKAGNNFKNAFEAYYMDKGNSPVNLKTIPSEMDVTILNEKNNVEYERKQQSIKEAYEKRDEALRKLAHDNPFLFAYVRS